VIFRYGLAQFAVINWRAGKNVPRVDPLPKEQFVSGNDLAVRGGCVL
jgi:hypothetical protein